MQDKRKTGALGQQGFWYRALVDAKKAEVKRYMQERGCSVPEAIDRVPGIRVGEG